MQKKKTVYPSSSGRCKLQYLLHLHRNVHVHDGSGPINFNLDYVIGVDQYASVDMIYIMHFSVQFLFSYCIVKGKGGQSG